MLCTMEKNGDFVCEDCGKKFDRKYNLQRHENAVHMKEIQKICKPSIATNKFYCCKCDRSFSNDSNLRRHERGAHIHKEPQVFICDVCGKSCRNRTEFEQHWRSNHSMKVFSLQRCPTCNIDIESKEILDHFVQVHEMKIEVQEYSFPNEDSFLEWKNEIENESYSRYIVLYKNRKRTITKYICHRSGFYQSHSKGFRRLKTQGSKKINGFCPASIRVEKSGAEVQVKFISTHVHVGSDKENEIWHLSISPMKKKEIATKLIDKIPKNRIIEDIRDSYEGINLKREHWINVQDVANVAAKYKISSECTRRQNVSSDLDLSTQELQNDIIWNEVPLVYEEENAEFTAAASEINHQRKNVTKKSLNQYYLRIIKNIKTNAGRVLLKKCLEEAEKKIDILERRI